MYFKRKAYGKLLEWKRLYSDKYAVLLEGVSYDGNHFVFGDFFEGNREISSVIENRILTLRSDFVKMHCEKKTNKLNMIGR